MNQHINIRVKPNSSRSKIEVNDEGGIIVYLNSPPVDGKANKECISLFSKKLKISKSSISIHKGQKGKNKILLIEGEDNKTVIAKLRD